MKKIAVLFCIGAFFICTAYSEEKKNFIKVDKNVEIDEKVYEFFYDFFSKHSKNNCYEIMGKFLSILLIFYYMNNLYFSFK